MGRLASQSATQKLGQILGLLVIPILVLWTVYFIQAKRDIDVLAQGIFAIDEAQSAATPKISNEQFFAIMMAAAIALESHERSANAFFDVRAHKNTVVDFSSNLQLALGQLKPQLAAERSAEWRNLAALTLAGFICSFAGIGLSVLMMRSTFVRLDEVERAHLEAQAAKREAEQVAVRFTTINNDISNLNQELASKVKSLNDAQDELIRKNRIEHLGQLTATIAHEIRNPLGAIRTSTFMLERKTSKAGLDTLELTERINNSVNRCDSIISQLHDFAKVKEPHNATLKLDDWLSKIVRDEASRLPPSIFIECSLGLEDLKITFDPALLKRAVINVLNNACEALLGDTQKVDSAKQKFIWVTTLRVNDQAVIRIADNGPGITTEHIDKIREPLFTTKSFGSGLGLAVVEQIAKLQGGHLDIASHVGDGATISIHLPISKYMGASHAA